MKRALLPLAVLIVAFALLAPAGGARTDPDAREWIQLFNGKTLDGWDVKISGHDLNDNFGNTFRVENGLLETAYDAYGPQFHDDIVRVQAHRLGQPRNLVLALHFHVASLFLWNSRPNPDF